MPTKGGSAPYTTTREPSVTGTTNDADRLRTERDNAVARARELEMELGEMRGMVKRLELIMWRRTARRQMWQSRIKRVLAKVRRT